jgi:hypothetical protein
MKHKLVEQFPKEYPIILLHGSEELNNEIIENTKLDPDSIEAWYDEDKTGAETDLVRVGNFIWYREKSNENVTNIDDGKGFSFYYARYAFNDKKKRTIQQKEGRNKTVAKISDSVYSVIDTEDDRNFTRIISAWKITDPYSQWIRFYYRGGEKQVTSIIKFGEPIYIGADDKLSEKYTQEVMNDLRGTTRIVK